MPSRSQQTIKIHGNEIVRKAEILDSLYATVVTDNGIIIHYQRSFW
jgi:hypothetical protein